MLTFPKVIVQKLIIEKKQLGKKVINRIMHLNVFKLQKAQRFEQHSMISSETAIGAIKLSENRRKLTFRWLSRLSGIFDHCKFVPFYK